MLVAWAPVTKRSLKFCLYLLSEYITKKEERVEKTVL